MIESFVDLTYRGVSLGRRIKLAQVRPSTGYLEMPTPMPVGTPIAIVTDEGVSIEARVIGVHEQVGGSDRVPGMLVKPEPPADERASVWWQARVTLPELEQPKQERNRSAPGSSVVRPRTHTVPDVVTTDRETVRLDRANTIPDAIVPNDDSTPTSPSIAASVIEAIAIQDQSKKTKVMDAVDQDLLAQLTRSNDERVARTQSGTGIENYPIVDDGVKTQHMSAVDVSALGLGIEVTASGSMRAVTDADVEETDGDDDSQPIDVSGGPNQTSPGIGDGKQKKRRKKRR